MGSRRPRNVKSPMGRPTKEPARATATALMISRHHPGSHFLLVSTDPAHSLSDSLADDCLLPPNLKILELNAREALAEFKQKHAWKLREIATRGTFFDEDDISQFLDLSLPGLDELMAFLEITSMISMQGAGTPPPPAKI